MTKRITKLRFFTFTIILLLVFNMVSAQDFFDEANNYVSKGNYGTALTVLQDNCPTLTTEIYNYTIWKCNFNMAFVYENLASTYINGESIAYNKRTLNLSREHYERAIEIDNLNPYGVNFSPPILLAHIEVATGNYAKAMEILSELEMKMSHFNLSILDLKRSKEYDVLFTTIPKLVSLSINEIGFLGMYTGVSPSTHTGILLNSIFSIDKDIPFIEILSEETFPKSIDLCYNNLINEQECNEILKDENGYFKFNEQISLERYGDFPYDTYHAEISMIPNIVSSKTISLETPLIYKGVVDTSKGNIDINISRTLSGIIIFYILFIITALLLWKYNCKWKSLITIISFGIALFLIYDFTYEFLVNAPWSLFNLHIYFLILLVPIKTIIKKLIIFCRKKRKNDRRKKN